MKISINKKQVDLYYLELLSGAHDPNADLSKRRFIADGYIDEITIKRVYYVTSANPDFDILVRKFKYGSYSKDHSLVNNIISYNRDKEFKLVKILDLNEN